VTVGSEISHRLAATLGCHGARGGNEVEMSGCDRRGGGVGTTTRGGSGMWHVSASR
jgi:hypothetical protein